jgi:hypothetical protein
MLASGSDLANRMNMRGHHRHLDDDAPAERWTPSPGCQTVNGEFHRERRGVGQDYPFTIHRLTPGADTGGSEKRIREP